MGYRTLFDSVMTSSSNLAQFLQVVTDRLHVACEHYLRRKRSFAVSVADQPPNNHSFECRPRHGSLPLEVLRIIVWALDCVLRAWSLEVCCGCWGWAARVLVLGICLGGDIMGELDRRGASRDRLLERPRTRALIAPKKDCSVGEVARDVGEAGERGGDIWPDDNEFCELAVFVRMGGMGWKLGWEVIVGIQDSTRVRCDIDCALGMFAMRGNDAGPESRKTAMASSNSL
jgi:hypothetical protein